MKKYIGSITCFFLGITGFIAQEKTLTLTDAIKQSIAYNKNLEQLAVQSKEAELSLKEVKNLRLPDANFDLSSAFFVGKPKVVLSVPTMGLPSPSPDYMITGTLGLQMPIYSGGKIKHTIEAASYTQKIIQDNIETQKQDIALQVIEQYASLYKVQQAQNVLVENIKRASQRVKDFTNLEKNGIIPRNDLMRAQLGLSNVQLSLTELKKNEAILNYNLHLLMGETDTVINYKTQLETLLIVDGMTEIDFVNQAYENRKEFDIIENQKKISEAMLKVAKADYFPQIGISFGYRYFNLDETLRLSNALNIGLGVKYNIANLFKNKPKVALAQIEAEKLMIQTQQLQDAIKMKLHAAYIEYQYNDEKIKVAQEAVNQSQENYRIVKRKYDNGLANTDDLLMADVEELQAQLNLSNATTDKLLNYYRLQHQLGALIIP